MVAIVQTATWAAGTSGSFASAAKQGNSVILLISDYNVSGGTITSSNPQYNSASVAGAVKLYEVQNPDISPSNRPMSSAAWLLPNVQSSGTSVSYTNTNGNNDSNSGHFIAEVSGLGPSPALDPASPNPATGGADSGTAWSSGASGAMVSPSGLVVANAMNDNGAMTGPGSPWTTVSLGTPPYPLFGYQVITSAGSTYTFSGTITASEQWSAGVALITAGGYAPQPPRYPLLRIPARRSRYSQLRPASPNFVAVGSFLQNSVNTVSSITLSTNNQKIGDLILVAVRASSATVNCTGASGGGAIWKQFTPVLTGTNNAETFVVFAGTVTALGPGTATFSFNGTANLRLDGQEFISATGTWSFDGYGTVDSAAGVFAWASLTPSGPGDLYFGSCQNSSTSGGTSTAGYVNNVDANGNDTAYNENCSPAVQAPQFASGGELFGIMTLVSPSAPPAPPEIAAQRMQLRVPVEVTRKAPRSQAAFTQAPITPAVPLPRSHRAQQRQPDIPPRGVIKAVGGAPLKFQPLYPTVAIRDTRREPRIPPRSNIAGWDKGLPPPPQPVPIQRLRIRPPWMWRRDIVAQFLSGGISQPPIPPIAERSAPRPVRIPRRGSTASWDKGISQPLYGPMPERAARQPVRLPPWRFARGSSLAGISQPLYPTGAERAARRPMRLPPWWFTRGATLAGVSQPPIPPQAVRDVRRQPRIPSRSNLAQWDKGISQPPIPPQAVRNTRFSLRFRKGWQLLPGQPSNVQAPSGPLNPVAVRGARRPVRFPFHQAQAQPGGGISQVAALSAPQTPPSRRPSWLHARARAGQAPPAVTAFGARSEGRPARPAFLRKSASATVISGGVSQPPILPVSVRDTRFPLRFRRSATEVQPVAGTPYSPPVATPSKTVRIAALFRARRPMGGAFQPPPPAVQVQQNPPPRWGLRNLLPKWLTRGRTIQPPGPTTTPLIPPANPPDIAGPHSARWQVQKAGARWRGDPASARWKVKFVPNFDPVAAVSLEQIPVSWTSTLAGTKIDPTGQTTGQPLLTVSFAFPLSSGNPDLPGQPVTWVTGSWLLGQTTPEYIALCLVGPNPGVIQLTAGQKYDVWSRITGNPEIPAKYAGTIAVY